MTDNKCLNCEKVLVDRFCSGCGQKADTHRISFENFFYHDVLHGTFHIEKGMLFTAKQALIQPGKAALDYISGKRKPYYNVFYLILITVGLIIFSRHYLNEFPSSNIEKVVEAPKELNEASKKFDDIFSNKSKLIILLFVPLSAINSFILFRRKKLNLGEHSILSGMILLGMLIISLFGNLFFYLNLIVPFSPSFASVMSILVTSLMIIFTAYGYFNAFKNDYSKSEIAVKIVLFFILLSVEILILFLILFGLFSNWKFGSVSLSPFG